jgi:hypothetical protein
MEEHVISDLSSRIAKLETKIKRDRTIGLSVIVLLLATAQAPGPSGPVTVRDATGASATLTAAGLTMRDASNQLRMAVGLDTNSLPAIDMRDAAGKLRQTIYVSSTGGPETRMLDANGTARFEYFLAQGGENPTLFLFDANGKKRAGLFQGTELSGELDVFGSDEKTRGAFVGSDAGGYMVMKDAAATTRVSIGLYTSGAFGMDVRNAAGTAVFSTP